MATRVFKMTLATVVVACSADAGRASMITFTGGTPGTDHLAASAKFDLAGSTLTITLTNTATGAIGDVMNPADLLTALFFSLPDGVSLATSGSTAYIASGSTWYFDSDSADPGDFGGNVGGEWAYGAGLVGAPESAKSGISSAGFDLFGDATFNGANLHGPTAVNGFNYAITSAGDDVTTGNAAVTGGKPLIKNAVVFSLTVSGALDLNKITDVGFQYGTGLGEPYVPVNQIPAPGAALLGVLGLGLLRLRRPH